MMHIAEIQRFCMHDGPGIRTTVFFKGCHLNCAWCHNPETQSAQPQILFYKNKCIGCRACERCLQNAHRFGEAHYYERDLCVACGKCSNVCPTRAIELVGREYTVQELFEQIKKDIAFYGDNGGVTFSGGECMLQIEPLCEILKLCKENGIHTAVDTSGHITFENFDKVLPYTDLFLYDIKCYDTKKHQEYVGVGNELILDNLKRLLSFGANVWVRIPIITSVNDNIDEMQKIKKFLDSNGKVQRVELLPYHAMGESKTLALGKPSRSFASPTNEQMQLLQSIFE